MRPHSSGTGSAIESWAANSQPLLADIGDGGCWSIPAMPVCRATLDVIPLPKKRYWRGNTDDWNFDSGGKTSVETPASGSD